MKYLILFTIRIYWNLISEKNRKKCIFRKSCSNYVFETTNEKGFIEGLKAFKYRYYNCRGNFEIFKNPINNETLILLPSKKIITSQEITERLIN
ncbi:membrane protein insertion efficiency factor YidD [Flavobacterium sp. GA093]|uniref:Membrane protein insertion efficiency factor YidD n=1 Tax=Flavobacterium hydrocarbonoxydans TaxID=2683249 RepID=A0A6I4NRU9_9FLAO|nr:membrane protein insertion efficiency factor YidD [Flavobacterium hydrocarbonoxydans]MWB96851.1 membrane protein insertion efficiency factor YidD [Flavobacterium hydrocarbonoxydans]